MEVSFGPYIKRRTHKEIRQMLSDGKLKGECSMKHVLKKQAEEGEAVPVQELGGVLNSSLAESLRKQRENKIRMRVALFNILSKGGKPVGPEVTYPERQRMLQDILQHLPAEKFHLPETATEPEAQQAMWERIQAGRNPRTREGIVAFPETGAPVKVKISPEFDTVLSSMFPGKGKYKDVGVGGFEYSLPGSEKVVGKVGSGISDALRRRMYEEPEQFVGRTARIRAQSQYPSGDYRAPVLVGMHEG
jgi:ATP-dependent DNA ligase